MYAHNPTPPMSRTKWESREVRFKQPHPYMRYPPRSGLNLTNANYLELRHVSMKDHGSQVSSQLIPHRTVETVRQHVLPYSYAIENCENLPFDALLAV